MLMLRRVFRITAIISWSAAIFLAALPWLARKDRASTRKIGDLSFIWTKGIGRIAGLKVTVRGKRPSGKGGLVVSNHTGYLDIVAHGSVIPSRFTPKSDVKSWPLIGPFISLSRPIWIDRRSKKASTKTLDELSAAIKDGYFVVAYPEGTSTDGRGPILPFKSTPFEAVIQADGDIYPVITLYKEMPGSPELAWYGDMTLLPHLWSVLGIRSIEATVTFLEPIKPGGKTRKELAAHVHSVMLKSSGR